MSSVRFRKRILFGLPIPAAPSLSAPAAVTSDTTPTFEWGAVSGAATYDLQVATTAIFDAPLTIDETGIAVASYTPGDALDAFTTYYARVRGVNAGGVAGAWSDTLTFGFSLSAKITSLSPAQWLNDTSPIWLASNGTGATSNGGRVGRWDDISGNNKHVLQATYPVPENRPVRVDEAVNGLRVLYADTTTAQTMTANVDGTAWSGITLVILVKPTANNTTRGLWSFANSATSGTPLVLCQRNNADVRFYLNDGYRFTIAHAQNATKLYILTGDQTTWRLWVDDTQQSPYVGGFANQATATVTYLWTGFSAASTAQIGEIILFNKAITETQAGVLATMLKTKWGL